MAQHHHILPTSMLSNRGNCQPSSVSPDTDKIMNKEPLLTEMIMSINFIKLSNIIMADMLLDRIIILVLDITMKLVPLCPPGNTAFMKSIFGPLSWFLPSNVYLFMLFIFELTHTAGSIGQLINK